MTGTWYLCKHCRCATLNPRKLCRPCARRYPEPKPARPKQTRQVDPRRFYEQHTTDNQRAWSWYFNHPEIADYCDTNAARILTRCRAYSITPATWLAMIAHNGSRCAICDKSHEPLALNVDHDHHTGQVRGLLCRSCNTGLGHLGIDGPDARKRVAAVINYLNGRTAGTARLARTARAVSDIG